MSLLSYLGAVMFVFGLFVLSLLPLGFMMAADGRFELDPVKVIVTPIILIALVVVGYWLMYRDQDLYPKHLKSIKQSKGAVA